MKKRLLVVLLVLSLVLVGCGKKDYTDIDVFEDLVVDSVNSVDKDFFKRNKKALKELNIQDEVKELKNAIFDLYDELLDFMPKEAEKLYMQLSENLSELTIEDLTTFQMDLNDEYSYMADPEEIMYFKEEVAEELMQIKLATSMIKKIPEDTVEMLQKKIQAEADEYGIDPSDIIEDALSEYM